MLVKLIWTLLAWWVERQNRQFVAAVEAQIKEWDTAEI
jgi:hypothetical protein